MVALPPSMKETAMPGGRLTQPERQQIALGLADGLAYAEIARRLERPTSTVTREVMRNGGPTAYRADLAHRATGHRAQRRRQPAPGHRGPRRSPTDATPGRYARTRRRSPPSSCSRAPPG
ncbi:Helix-turn-helix domain-containing protein [Streptomyces sp. DconLS]|nr:Helix-turn-helix domain-containing protein [Streptomyces sp. DconLS]